MTSSKTSTSTRRLNSIPPTDREPRVAALVPDLITASRIESAVAAVGGTFVRHDDPRELPSAAHIDLLAVDWGFRRDDWGERLTAWRSAGPHPALKIILFGPHTDLEAHAAAKASGLGPMKARSAFFAALPGLLSERRTPPG